MPRISFDDLPDEGRLWVFPARRPLTPPERDALLGEVDDFLDGWAAHGTPLHAARSLWEEQFLLVGVDHEAAGPSGCSIDALTNRIRNLGKRMGVTLIEHGSVWYRENGRMVAVSRPDFRELAREGRVDPETRVVDTTLTRVAEGRNGGLERRAGESWHDRAFFRERTAR